MTDETKRELAQNAIRWCNNILCEVLNNCGEAMGDVGRDELSEALRKLQDADAAIRKHETPDITPWG